MKIWRVDYYSSRDNCYKYKLVKAENAEQAIKKSRIKNIVDLQIIDEVEQ